MSEDYNKNRGELIMQQIDKYGYLFCQKCNQNHCGFKFEVHHIVFRSEAPNHPMLHHKKNLIICGSDCHKEAPDSFHKDKGQRDHYVIERGLEALFGMNLIIN